MAENSCAAPRWWVERKEDGREYVWTKCCCGEMRIAQIVIRMSERRYRWWYALDRAGSSWFWDHSQTIGICAFAACTIGSALIFFTLGSSGAVPGLYVIFGFYVSTSVGALIFGFLGCFAMRHRNCVSAKVRAMRKAYLKRLGLRIDPEEIRSAGSVPTGSGLVYTILPQEIVDDNGTRII